MRRELEILALIDDFLDGDISRQELEKNLGDIIDLDHQIYSQKLLREAIKKEVFIQQSQKSLSKFKLIKVITIVSLSIAIIGLLVVGAFVLKQQTAEVNEIRPDQLSPTEQKSSSIDLNDELIDKVEERNDSNKQALLAKSRDLINSNHPSKSMTAGIWKGQLEQNEISYDFALKLIKIDSIHYHYISKITIEEQYAIMQGKAQFIKNVLSFKEKRIKEENSVDNKWCLKTGKLTRKRTKQGILLSGKWWGKCAPGTMELHRIKDDNSLGIYSPIPR